MRRNKNRAELIEMDAVGSRLSFIRIAQILLYINAVIWLVLGSFTLLRLSQYYPESIFVVWIITILMVGNGGMMLLCGWGLVTGHRLFYYLSLTVLAINIILTFTDQFGLLDFLTLLIDLTIMALLIASHQRFFHTQIAK